MMTPQRAYISGPSLDHVRGMIVFEPQVGDPLQLFLDDGKVMRTSAVRHVSRRGDELVVDTQNSQYRVELLRSQPS
jgi:hypothetical protein